MELEQFIEEDVRSFLDRRQAEAFSGGAPAPTRQDDVLEPEEILYAPGRDYVTEMDAALAEHDPAKARRILFSLKESYDQYPPDAPERAEQQRLLQSLYNRFQQALRTDRALQEEALAEGGRSVFPASAPSQPPEAQKPSPPPQPPGLSSQEERALAADITQVETLLAEGSVGAAMRVYHVVRRNLSPEQLTQEQRRRIIPRLRAAYDAIVRRLTSASAPVAPKRDEAQLNRSPKGAVQLFRERAAAAERAVTGQDPAEAMRQYRGMRSLYTDLPAGEQNAAKGTLQATYRRIENLLHAQPRPQPGVARATAAGPAQNGGAAVLDDEERRLIGAP
jgi:hypothetical protein